MGKISDALKKVTEERAGYTKKKTQKQFSEMQKQSSRMKKVEESLPDKYKEAPTLKDRIESFTREVAYVAKAADKTGIDARIVAYHDYSSSLSEQYRILRTNVKSYLKNGTLSTGPSRSLKAPRLLTVTSSLHNEGKTVTCVNLAVALAKDPENKVLLIDADLRNGTVHKLLNLDSTPGISEVLQSDFDYAVALHPTPVKNLFVIPRGHTVGNPSELLGSRKMRTIMERLKNEPLTHIVIDTPPIVPFTDAAVLCPYADASMLVVQAYRTQEKMVHRAKGLIEQAHGKFLGFVLTQTDHYTPDYYSYYYYYRSRNEGSTAEKEKIHA